MQDVMFKRMGVVLMYGVRSQAGKLRYLGISSRPACFPNTASQGAQYSPEAFTPARSGNENDMHLTDYNLPYLIYNYTKQPPTSIQEPERLFGFEILSKEDGSHKGYLVCEAVHGTHGATGYYVDIRWAKFLGDTRVDTFPFPNTHIWWEVDGTHADAVNLTAGFFLDEVDGKEILGVNFTHVSGVYGPNDNGYFDRDTSSWIFTKEGTLLLDPETETLNYEETDDPNDDNPDDEDRNREGGNSGTDGGNGDHTHHNDIIPIPDFPTLSAGAAGFVTLYNPTLSNVQALADQLYSDSVIQWIDNFINKPQDMICGLGIVPVQPTTSGLGEPKLGTHVIHVAMPVILSQFAEVDCGSVHLSEFYGSALDYSPYSKLQIYLPYIGFRELDVDEVMCYTVSVVYHIDLYNGNCIAFVTLTRQGRRTVRMMFSGNCLQQIPVNGNSYDEVVANGIRLASVAVAAAATAGAAGAAVAGEAAAAGATAAEAQAAGQAAQAASMASSSGALAGSTASAIMSSKPRVERSGTLGGSVGHMGVQKPFIVREIPRQSIPTNYKHYRGYPSNITYRIVNLSGFTIMDSVRITGVPGTDAEISEIYSILTSGFIA